MNHPDTPYNRLSPHERYHRDSTFAALVNMLEHALWQCDYTPTELREAVMLAAERHLLTMSHKIAYGAPPDPECTCKNRERPHEPGCHWHGYHEGQRESALRAMMDFEAMKIAPVAEWPPKWLKGDKL